MSEDFFHYPDETVFHGSSEYPNGFLFSHARSLLNENDKLFRLNKRLTGYYVNGLIVIPHAFMMAIMTCIGVEVLGQVILGYNNMGRTIEANTIRIYEMLDPALQQPLSDAFKSNYAINRNISVGNVTRDFPTYAHILRKGLRNAFSHTYRSLGVFLGDTQQNFMSINDNEGYIVLDPGAFRQQFVSCYQECFEKVISNSNSDYRQNALKYFELLVR